MLFSFLRRLGSLGGFFFGPEIKSATTLVLGNCSKMILKNTVSGMDMISPGTPQI